MGIEIPDNAIALLDEALKQVDSLRLKCITILGNAPVRAPIPIGEVDQIKREASRMLIWFKLFPFRWVLRDPSDADVISAEREKYGWAFVEYERIDSELYSVGHWGIPAALYNAFDRISGYGQWGKGHSSEIVRLKVLCEDVVYELRVAKDRVKAMKGARRVAVKLVAGGRILECPRGIFDFTTDQAPVIKVMFDNYEGGNDFMAEQAILDEAGRPTTTFSSLFKSIKKKAEWKIFERHETQSDLWRLKLE